MIQRRKLDMSRRIDERQERAERNKPLRRHEWELNHNHPVGQDAFKDDHEIETEEKAKRLNKGSGRGGYGNHRG